MSVLLNVLVRNHSSVHLPYDLHALHVRVHFVHTCVFLGTRTHCVCACMVCPNVNIYLRIFVPCARQHILNLSTYRHVLKCLCICVRCVVFPLSRVEKPLTINLEKLGCVCLPLLATCTVAQTNTHTHGNKQQWVCTQPFQASWLFIRLPPYC